MHGRLGRKGMRRAFREVEERKPEERTGSDLLCPAKSIRHCAQREG